MQTHVSMKNEFARPCMTVMNFLNEATYRYRDAISLAAGRPPDQFVSAERAGDWISIFVRERTCATGLSEEAVWRSLGQYGPTNGMIADLVARLLARDEGMSPAPESLMITNGMQEALLLLLLGTCDGSRDVVLSDDPTYVGLTGAATLVGVPVVTLPTGGTMLKRVSRALEAVHVTGRRARALYLIPDFSNPLGSTLALAERQQLLDLARCEELLLIEDTAYRAFRYEGETIPSLKALDRDGVVVQVGSFSKLFMPGPRIGYLYADQGAVIDGVLTRSSLAEELSKAKSFVSVLTSPLVQAMLGGFLIEQGFTLAAWNRPRLRLCRENRDALIATLEERVGADSMLRGSVHWTRPDGGFFLTVTLPFPFGTDEMMTCARDYHVIVCPMAYFSTESEFACCVRLSFSNITPEHGREGVVRLHRFIRDEVARRGCK